MTEIALYVHFPWCVRKCPYCDFNSHPLKHRELDAKRYVDALLLDIDCQLADLESIRFGSVFCGGGTPSLFPPSSFATLLDRLAPFLAPDAEITMEVNPGTAEHHDFGEYLRAGINRLSFGAQSFDDTMLKALGRVHDSSDIYRSFALARQAGFDNINLDLMYGLPDQTRQQAMADLDAAIELCPEHLSWYQLTLEPKTEFARRPPPLPSDIVLEAVELSGYERMEDAGLRRYEVSAYARTGHRCRHNLQYWTFGDYLGAGAGAHGKLSGGLPGGIIRTSKASQPRLYLDDPSTTRTESVDRDRLPGEFMLNALRLTNGVALGRFETTTGLGLDVLEPARSSQIDSGLLERDRLAATNRGYQLLDSLIEGYL